MKDITETLIDLAILEDLGSEGDLSSQALDLGDEVWARIIAREAGVLSGVFLLPRIFQRFSKDVELELRCPDASHVSPGQTIVTIKGPVAAILSAERIALNFLGFLSGIATTTASYVKILAEFGGTTKLLDTRKTLPGFRSLAKTAVLHGGGHNHRQGLYDMIMLKDNHIDAAGGIPEAVAAARARFGSRYKIEVECRSLEELAQALKCHVDIAMLDNMSPEECQEALRMRHEGGFASQFEASGDMDEERIRAYAGLGLDSISVGRLTHSVRNLNFSLLYGREEGTSE